MTRIIALLIALSYMLPGHSAPLELRADRMALSVDREGLITAQARQDPAFLRSARLVLFDGRGKRPLTVTAAAVRRQGKGIRIEYAATATKLAVVLDLEPRGRCMLWRVTCRNAAGQQQWVELGPELVLCASSKLTAFDGYNDDVPAPDKPIAMDKLQVTFPLAIAWSPAAAAGVGMAPDQLPSYLRHEFRPGEVSVLGSYGRIVVDAGKQERVTFVTCCTRGEWGKYEVFEAYYDSFPRWFAATPGVDPRASMGGAQYRAYPVRQWSPEICRRLWCGWEWCYAPFRRTGDIVGRPEFWQYDPARPFGGARKLPMAKYKAWRKKAFEDGAKRCGVAMMFYIPAQIWCEERLARERYADALTTDPKVRTSFYQPWVTGHDNELRMFPYGTAWAEQSRRDMKQVAQELDLAGFAFDTAGGCARYRGPALDKLEHRAWDKDGVFCNENVAVAKLMDFTHTIEKAGRPLAVVANIGAGTYTSCFHCDSAMLEGEPWKLHRTFGDRLRWKLGHKTGVWWEGYGLQHFIDADRASAEQVKAVYRGLSDFTILQSFRVGLIPPPNFTHGVRKLVHWMPALTECVRLGWEPVPAARVPEPLWTSRYGRGIQTRIAVAHETGEPVSATLRIQNDRLGPGAHLFAPYHAGSSTNTLRDGDTEIPLTVPSRALTLLRCVCAITPVDAVESAEVSLERGIDRWTVRAAMSARPGKVRIAPAVPPDMRVHSVALNGRALEARATAVECELLARNELTVTLASTVFDCTGDELVGFPFVKDDRPNCTIVVPEDASDTLRLAAFRIQEYFRYVHGRALRPTRDVVIPIAGARTSQHKRSVTFAVGAPPRVALKGDTLALTAPDDTALLDLTFKLLRALDTRHDYPDQLPATALHRRVGIADKVLEPARGAR